MLWDKLSWGRNFKILSARAGKDLVSHLRTFPRELWTTCKTGMFPYRISLLRPNILKKKKKKNHWKSTLLVNYRWAVSTLDCASATSLPCVWITWMRHVQGSAATQYQPDVSEEFLFTSDFPAVMSNCFSGFFCLSDDKTNLKTKIFQKPHLLHIVILEQLQTNTDSGQETAAQHYLKILLIWVLQAKSFV